MAAGPGGMPVTSAPVPTGVKNHYAFIFPIRPGRSQLQVTYKLPYNGSHDFAVSPDLPLAEFGVMLPKGMGFTPAGESFSPASDESGMAVFVAKSISPGQQLSFSLAGEGTAPREAQADANMGAGQADSGKPGGGLGAPIGASEPTSSVRWYVLGVVLIALAGGAVWIVKRKPGSAGASHVSGGDSASHASTSSKPPSSKSSSSKPSSSKPGRSEGHSLQPTTSRSSVLDVIKEELFQLESDRLMGKISQEEYQAAKSGLDALLRRQMKKAD
jgi:hypothetical protein